MYAVVWEYQVRPEKAEEFVDAYGADGAWARLFAQAEGYLGTSLYCACEARHAYLTIDRWRDQDAFTAFMSEFGDAYDVLDGKLESLTLAERRLGELAP